MLSLPFALRYRLAWDHELSLKVLRIFWRALDRYHRKRAKERGLVNPRTGAVTVIQRAGGAETRATEHIASSRIFYAISCSIMQSGIENLVF